MNYQIIFINFTKIVCFILASWQAILISKRFFENETEMVIELIPQVYDYLPGVTIGLDIQNLDNRRKSMYDDLKSDYCNRNKTAISEQRKKILYDKISQELSCSVLLTPSGYSTDCSKISNLVFRLSEEMLFITFFERSASNFSFPKFKYFIGVETSLFVFTIFASKYYCVYLHQPNSFKYDKNQCKLMNEHQGTITKFEKKYLKLLKAPYKTNCIDYKEIGFDSSGDCKRKCTIEMTKNVCNANLNISKEKARISEERIEFDCNRKCSQDDCEQEIFEIDYTISRDYSGYIEIRRKSNVVVKMVTVPLFTVLDTFIALGSIFAFWIDFSIFTFIMDQVNFCFFVHSLNDINQQNRHRKHYFIRRKRKRRHYRNLRKIILAICVILSLIQMIMISYSYFEYDVRVEIFSANPKYQLLPAFTIVTYTLNIETVRIRKDGKYFLLIEPVRKFLSSQNFSSQFKCIIHSIDDGRDRNCTDIIPAKISYQRSKGMITYFYSSSYDEQYHRKFRFDTKNDIRLFTFAKAPFFFHENAVIPNRERTESMRGDHYFIYEYRSITQQLLPKPYKSNCFDFSKLNLGSAEHCFNKCIKNLSKKNKLLYDHSVITIEDLLDVSDDFLIATDRFDHLKRPCLNRCMKSACFKTDYMLDLKEIIKTGYAGITINRPSSLQQFIVLRPKLSIIESINLIFGTIAFWCSFSILMLNNIKFSIYFNRNHLPYVKNALNNFFLLIAIMVFIQQMHSAIKLYEKYEFSLEIIESTDDEDIDKNILPNFIMKIDCKRYLSVHREEKLDFIEIALTNPNFFNIIEKCNCNLTNIYTSGTEVNFYFTANNLSHKNASKIILYNLLIKIKRGNIFTRKGANNNFQISLSSNKEKLLTTYKSIVDFNFRPFDEIDIFYDKIEYHYLSAPYESNCVEYKTIGFKSRHDCIEKCMELLLSRKYSTKIVNFIQIDNKTEKYGLISFQKMNLNEKNELHHQCLKKCRFTDCVVTHYIPYFNKVRSSKNDRKAEKNFALRVFHRKNQPVIQYKLKEKLRTIDLFIGFGNVVGICFGLCVHSMIISFIEILQKYFNLFYQRFALMFFD